MNSTNAKWEDAYRAYLKSGLSKADFYHSVFKKFCQSRIPALATFYAHFRQLDKVGEVPVGKSVGKSADNPVIKPIANTKAIKGAVRVVTLSSADIARGLQACGEAPHNQAQHFSTAQAALRPFRVLLPNGTRLEFDSVAPEALALRMVCFAGGAA